VGDANLGFIRLIVLWQVSWFSVSTLLRLKENLPMTTFELTALSFSLTMLITSLCWYAKPTISTPTKIRTKDNMKIEEIRTAARGSVRHPDHIPPAQDETGLMVRYRPIPVFHGLGIEHLSILSPRTGASGAMSTGPTTKRSHT
jgi:hypothetical protein